MLFDIRVAIQGPTEVRTGSGDVTYTYANVAGKENLPARIVAVTEERRGERLTVTEDRFDVLLGGVHTDLTSEMVVNGGDAGVYDIVRVIPAARRARPVTQLVARLVAI